jgi:hypothetical protein
MNSGAVDAAASCRFGFESDLERSLACIPMAVRFKVDKCEIKLIGPMAATIGGQPTGSVGNAM